MQKVIEAVALIRYNSVLEFFLSKKEGGKPQ